MNNMPLTHKIFKYTVIAILGLFTLILLSFTVLSLTYENTIIKYLKKYLNDHLLTEIIVDRMDFSMLKRFPYATVEFSNVLVKSRAGLDQAGFPQIGIDTLLSASKVYFQFGLIGLLKNEYQLKKIHLIGGKTNILTDASGRNNYSIWRSSAEKAENKPYQIDFNNVTLTSFDFHYVNVKDKLSTSFSLKKSVFSGSFAIDHSSYSLKSDLFLFNLSQDGETYLCNLPVYMNFNVHSQYDSITLSQCDITLNKLLIQFQGQLQLHPSFQMDITLSSANFGLDEIFSVLPFEDKPFLKAYSFEGKGKVKARITRSFSDINTYGISSVFSLSNGSVINRKTKSKLSHISIDGSFSGNNPRNYTLQINTFDSRLSTGRIYGSLKIKDFKLPAFSLDLNSTINLNNLNHFINNETIEYLTGAVQASIKAQGFLNSVQITPSQLLSKITSGNIEFENCSFKFKENDYAFQDINGKMRINNSISFQDFALTINQTNFLMTGNIDNLFNYLSDSVSVINSNLYLYSKIIDGNSFVGAQSKSSDTAVLLFPRRISIKAVINADEIRLGKFDASSLKCEFKYEHEVLNINNFKLNYIDGSISGNTLIKKESDSLVFVDCYSELNQINIQELFVSCNNFGQDFILSDNLRGKLQGKVNFSADWDTRLHFIPSSLIAQADLEIINGELLKFDPMLSLSKYISVDELKHIRFKTLKNTLYIADQKIRIPEMQINSSAFKIALSGTHSFDNEFDYRLKVALSDVLFNKAKRKRKEIDDYLIMENDMKQTIIPLSIIGKPDQFDVNFDSKKAFDLVRENIQKQGTEMKGIFGNQQNPNQNDTLKSNNRQMIDWEEEKRQIPQKENRSRQSDDGLQIKWEEEDSSDMNNFH
jgi:hypothetical protein